MVRKISLITAILLFCLVHSIAYARPPRVVVLKSADIVPYNEAVEGFKKTCGCITEEISLSDTEAENLKQMILDQTPELILTVGVDALSQAVGINDIPIVYSMVPNPNPVDFSDRSISGVNMNIPPEKYINAIIELFPAAKRIGVVYDPKHLDLFIKEAGSHAKNRGLELVLRPVHRPADVLSSIDSLRNMIDIFLMLPDVTVVNSETFKYMLGFSFQNRLPLFTFTKKYVEMGAAAGLHVLPQSMGAQAGEIVRRILIDKNTRIPLRVDAKISGLVVNDTILKKLGAVVNDESVRRAAHVQ